MQRNWHYCLYIAAVYLVGVSCLTRFMKNRTAFRLRNVVFIWDVSLAIFSTFGMLRTVPEIWHVLQNYGLRFSVCNANCNSVTAFWGFAFSMSKAPELFDTALIVLKKQKLTYLHLIHHVVTLVVTWYNYMDHPALSRWVFGMNYSIHAFMYSYFALKATKVHIPTLVSMAITIAQICQMLLGLFASVVCMVFILTQTPCDTSFQVAVFAMLVYISFLYLFVNFFIHRYNVFYTKAKKVE